MQIKEKELGVPEDTHPVVEQMEKEWPVMTKEFKRLQRQQYELFLKNNMITVLVIYQLVLHYKLMKKYIYHLQVFGLE